MGNDYFSVYDFERNQYSIDYEALKYIIKEELKMNFNVVANTEAERVLTDILSSAKWRIISRIKVPSIVAKPIKAVLRFVKKIIKR